MAFPASFSWSPPSDNEVLVRVEGVSKKFCRSLKKSLWYGVCDIASELNPFGRNTGQSTAYKSLTTEDPENTTEHRGRCEMVQSQIGPEGEEAGATESKGGTGLGLPGQAGTAFSNPSTSELAQDSENTLLIRLANEPCLTGQKKGSDSSSTEIGEISGKQSDAPDGAGLRPGEFWAVKDVSFELRRGECLGLIGHNAAGNQAAGQPLGRLPKAARRVRRRGKARINMPLLKMLNGLIKLDAGAGGLIALGAGFNPILTGRR